MTHLLLFILAPLLIGKITYYICKDHLNAKLYGCIGALATVLLIFLAIFIQIPTEAETIGEVGWRLSSQAEIAQWLACSLFGLLLYLRSIKN